jgi:hypothetical protein
MVDYLSCYGGWMISARSSPATVTPAARPIHLSARFGAGIGGCRGGRVVHRATLTARDLRRCTGSGSPANSTVWFASWYVRSTMAMTFTSANTYGSSCEPINGQIRSCCGLCLYARSNGGWFRSSPCARVADAPRDDVLNRKRVSLPTSLTVSSSSSGGGRHG